MEEAGDVEPLVTRWRPGMAFTTPREGWVDARDTWRVLRCTSGFRPELAVCRERDLLVVRWTLVGKPGTESGRKWITNHDKRLKLPKPHTWVEVERVLCAAIWVDDGIERPALPRNLKTGLVFAAWRHHHCFTPLNAVYPRPTPKVDEEQIAGRHQGFLTTHGRFVDRAEAGHIAFAAGQVNRDGLLLSSEDLY